MLELGEMDRPASQITFEPGAPPGRNTVGAEQRRPALVRLSLSIDRRCEVEALVSTAGCGNRTFGSVRVARRNSPSVDSVRRSPATKLRADRTVFRSCSGLQADPDVTKTLPHVRLRSVFPRFGGPNSRSHFFAAVIRKRVSGSKCVRVGSIFARPEAGEAHRRDLKSALKTALAKAFSFHYSRTGLAPRLSAPGTRGAVPESTLSATLDCWSG